MLHLLFHPIAGNPAHMVVDVGFLLTFGSVWITALGAYVAYIWNTRHTVKAADKRWVR